MISAILPTWNEAATIDAAVQRARRIAGEVIVADASSPDGTAALAEAAGARVVHAPKGRGAQLVAGARAARGDVLLFVHADTTLAEGAGEAILRALADPRVVGGNFRLRFEGTGVWPRVFTWANDARRRWLRIYYGDSGLFVRRSTYEALGGFVPAPLFEDYDFVRRLERTGRTAYVRDVEIVASDRRFSAAPARTLFLWTLLQALYSLGVPPDRLARLYADGRPARLDSPPPAPPHNGEGNFPNRIRAQATQDLADDISPTESR